MTDGAEDHSTPEPPASPGPSRSDRSAGRVIGIVFAGIGGLIGLLLLVLGIGVLIAYGFGREDGFLTADGQRLESPTYAITAEDIDLGVDEVDWAPDAILGEVRIRVEGSVPVFVGIAPDAAVDRYLGRVARDELIDLDGDEPELDRRRGGAPPTPPGEQGLWVARAEGPGEQDLTWDAEFGRWTAVVMRADARRGIDVEADVGVKAGWVIWAGLGALVIGLLMTAGAIVVIVLIGRRPSPTAS